MNRYKTGQIVHMPRNEFDLNNSGFITNEVWVYWFLFSNLDIDFIDSKIMIKTAKLIVCY